MLAGIIIGGLATASTLEVAVIQFWPDAVAAEDIQHTESIVVLTLFSMWLLYHLSWVYHAVQSLRRMKKERIENAFLVASSSWKSIQIMKDMSASPVAKVASVAFRKRGTSKVPSLISPKISAGA